LLVEIGGRPVQELVDSGLPAAKGHAAVVALATAPTRPLAMTFRPHHARSARNKLKAAVGMKGMLKGLGAAKKTAPGASDIPTGTTVKINGRQWKVLDVADGMVQLQLCKAGGAVTASALELCAACSSLQAVWDCWWLMADVRVVCSEKAFPCSQSQGRIERIRIVSWMYKTIDCLLVHEENMKVD
jgi:hypothetical protein